MLLDIKLFKGVSHSSVSHIYKYFIIYKVSIFTKPSEPNYQVLEFSNKSLCFLVQRKCDLHHNGLD